MTIPTKEEALRACDELSDYAPSHPYAMSLRKTLRSYIESHTGEATPEPAGYVSGIRLNEMRSGKANYIGLYPTNDALTPIPLFASPVQPVKLEWRGYELWLTRKDIGVMIGEVHSGYEHESGWPWYFSFGPNLNAGDNYDTEKKACEALESTARQWLSRGDK